MNKPDRDPDYIFYTLGGPHSEFWFEEMITYNHLSCKVEKIMVCYHELCRAINRNPYINDIQDAYKNWLFYKSVEEELGA